jgi:hypothetical protein
MCYNAQNVKKGGGLYMSKYNPPSVKETKTGRILEIYHLSG